MSFLVCTLVKARVLTVEEKQTDVFLVVVVYQNQEIT